MRPQQASNGLSRWFVACLLSLSGVGQLAADDRDANPRHLFCLRARPAEYTPFKERTDKLRGDLLVRELIRQAVLLSAREEVGLATRDEALREPFPEPSDAVAVVDMLTQSRPKEGVWFKMLHQDELLWEHEQECLVGPVDQYLAIAQVMEKLSRESLPDYIRRLRLKGLDRPDANQGEVDEATRQDLADLNLLSQYDVVRACHAEIATSGESPARLGVLVRAYAHLGQLTQPFLSSMHRTFRARSLLYAQRMIAASPDAPHGWWHRGYALSLAGLQRWSIEDLEAAAVLADGAAEPPWVELLDDFNNYRFTELVKAATAGDELSHVAALLLFNSVETSKSRPLVLDTGMSVTKLNPFDLRTLDGMHREAGVGYKHMLTETAPQHFEALLTQKLPELRSIDADVQRAIDGTTGGPDSFAGRTEIGLALVDHVAAHAGKGEPSLAVLGRLIEEQNVLQFFRRGVFMRDSWSVETDGFVAEHRAAFAGHPLAKLLSCLAFEWGSRPHEYQRVLQDLEIRDTNMASMMPLLGRVPRTVSYANMTQSEAWSRLYHQRAAIEFEYFLDISSRTESKSRVQLAKWMYDISPHSAYRLHVLIKEDWEASQEKIVEENWEKRYGDHPLIAGAFAEQFLSQGELEKAASHYRRQIEIVPSIGAHRGLAKVLWKQEDEAWLSTLESALALEDYGLSHAAVNAQIAATLMVDQKYEQALPYAEEAASSYSGWSLVCLAMCHEGLGKWKHAEAVMQATSRRYNSGSWYHWCVRTGKGDIASAWREWQEVLRGYYPDEDAPTLKAIKTRHAIFTGKKRAGLELAKANQEAFSDPVNRLAHAMLADELGDHDEALELLDKLAKWAAESDEPSPISRDIVAVIKEIRAADEVNGEFIEAVRKKHPAAGDGTLNTFVGWHLANRGEQELAKIYLSGISGSQRWSDTDVLYAQVKLRELGVEIGDFPRRYDRACGAE